MTGYLIQNDLRRFNITAVAMAIASLVSGCSGVGSSRRSNSGAEEIKDSDQNKSPGDDHLNPPGFSKPVVAVPINGTNLLAAILQADCQVDFRTPCSTVRYTASLYKNGNKNLPPEQLKASTALANGISTVQWKFDDLPAGVSCDAAGMRQYNPECKGPGLSQASVRVGLVVSYADRRRDEGASFVIRANPSRFQSIGDFLFWISAQSLTGVNDGAEVASMADLTGNTDGARASSFPSVRPPLLSKTALNDKPALFFDGSIRGFETNLRASRAYFPDLTIVALARADQIDGNYRTIASFDGTIGGWQRGLGVWNTNQFYGQGGTSTNYVSLNASDPNAWKPIFLAYSSGMSIYVGSESSTFPSGGSGSGDEKMSIGFAPTGSPESQAFIGAIAEILIFKKALSAEDRQTVLEYFNSIYGTF